MAMLAPSVAITAFRDDHLPQGLALTRALRWPYRLEDWAFAHRLGRGYAVELDDCLAGTAFWWPYGEDYASLGMIVVAQEAQRRGIGAAMMDAMLADTGTRSLFLASTVAGRALYERLGFVEVDTIHQHQAVLTAAPAPVAVDATVRAATADDLSAIHALDRDAAGMERGALLGALLPTADVVVAERGGRVIGYGAVRTWGRGVVVGPVAASDADVARALIAALARAHIGIFVRIDTAVSTGLSPWLESLGLPHVDDAVAMVRGTPPPPGRDARLYALSNQSLG
ncbi:MAG: GNAT family N-acetyltransferase [Sphingomonas adhaesiva]|uniref:GNAT family N-acetyltransferase n=1 Tax=Sphingomonas adhaesiva TaxID=28212 RepID=UPI002FF49C71